MDFPIEKLLQAKLATKVRLFKQLSLKRSNTVQRIWFLTQCQKEKVIPNFIKISSPFTTKIASTVVREAQENWLKLEIREAYKHLDEILFRLKILHSEIAESLHPLEWDCLDNNIRNYVSTQTGLTKQRIRNKLDKFIKGKESALCSDYSTNNQ